MEKNNVRIAVIGLGYVGLPIMIEFSKKYHTIGYDIDDGRIQQLENGIDITDEIRLKDLKSNNLKFSNVENDIADCNIYIITVPTPVNKFNEPDMNPLKSASKLVGSVLKKNDIVIYESTVYPGATEDFCVPILETQSRLIYNKDFFCGYSPERINPGDKNHTLTKIKKITSGSNKKTATIVDDLYKSIIKAGTKKVKSISVAEAAKVIENIQRDVNIALINEFSMIFNKMGIDSSDVIEAASTKWNFMPFKPGLVGGHCIGVDPYYLSHKAKKLNLDPQMILAGRRINDSMGKYIADNAIRLMQKNKLKPSKFKVGILGITFKENCPDIRNTKVVNVIDSLKKSGCNTIVADPIADINNVKSSLKIKLVDIDKLSQCHSIIIATAHDEFKNLSINFFNKALIKRGSIIDVKSIFNKEFFNESTFSYWRL